MGKIVLLDDLTINQIAAGEVIERPASVVKELVENSIDAGAKNITVEIKNGGISYIRVKDDGSGILPDDMEISFERHATSKIRKAEDLDAVKTMGFRGEALASIAAIAKVEMISKTSSKGSGYRIEIEGGEIKDKSEFGSSKGTTITVQELFFNTPVRYKFLRKDFTEAGYIEEIMQRIALANPGVAIKLIDTGKTALQTSGSGKLEDTIYEIFGRQTVDNLLPVDYTYEDIHVTGVIGKPILSRSNRTNQLFFINKRYIKDKTLTSAADQGFKGLVTIGKHGFLILNLDMDLKKVDVNVHPTKLEVRFQEESKVFKSVYHAIKETLLKSDLISDPNKDYSDEKENTINSNITNSTRVKAWNITDSVADDKKEEVDSKVDAKAETKEETEPKVEAEPKVEKKSEEKTEIPEFDEFKDSIKDLNKEERKKLLAHVKNAKSSAEIMEILTKIKNGIALEDPEPEEEEELVIIDQTDEDEEAEETSKETEVASEEVEKEDSETKEEVVIEADEGKEEKSEEIEDIKVAEKSADSEANAQDKIDDDFEINPEGIEGEGENDEIKITGMIDDPDTISKAEETESKAEIKGEPVVDKVAESETKPEPEAKSTEEESQEDEDEELSFEEMYRKIFKHDLQDAKNEYAKKLEAQENETPIRPLNGEEISIFEKEGVDNNPKYKFIGIAFKTYIILTLGDDLYLLDQHAAHERIMYEKVKANYNNDTDKDSQLMLVPDIINLTNKEMGIFKDNKEMFNKAGFVADEFGDNTVKLTGVPEFCLKFNTQEIFLETLDEIDTVARTAKQEIEDKFLATIACKAAVKAHMALTEDEVNSLMSQLLELPNPFSCPHGRPTIIKMSKTDIEKKFSRRM